MLIEDAAQTHGALFKGRRQEALVTLLASTYPGKPWRTWDAGTICTQSQELAEKLGCFVFMVHEENMSMSIRFNSRLDEIQAAFLI